ncbi:EF-hand domain-containing family member B-like isoform X2 [Symsagittifera roscoffensis]|uniref:EF-hand domain-containing family member B-like isoform X2 n=1 Tax=Symsagittifera roscoffensis TaxID=84072 RepID=UPI00307BD88E
MRTNEGKFVDRNPTVPTAGKCFDSVGSVPECVQAYNPDKGESPAVTKRYRATYEPDVGATTVHYGKAADKEQFMAQVMTHGLVSNANPHTAAECVNPDPKTLFQQRVADKKESLYLSHQTRPLGQVPDQTPNLPEGTDIYEKQFGRPGEKNEYAGELINPPKSSKEVEEESKVGKDLYEKSHASWDAGEQVTRHYDWSRWDPSNRFGEPTPSDERGKHVKTIMYWHAQKKMDEGAIIEEKVLDGHREKYTDQLGQTRDPIKDTMKVGPDHTFGIIVKPDGYGVDDLLHGRVPKHYLRGKDRERALMAAVRQNLKTNNFNRFDDVAAAFNHYDKEGSGKLSIDAIRQMCVDYCIPIEEVVLESLFDFMRGDSQGGNGGQEGGQIDFDTFANFLHWQTTSTGTDSNGQRESYEETGETPRRIENQLDKQLGGYKTSASQVNAAVGVVPPQQDYRTYGTPTVRVDRPAPKYKSVSDRTNYGDEADAWGLMTPSVFTNSGVYEDDLFQPRSPEEVKRIFANIGEDFEDGFFFEVWNKAAEMHPKALVNMECFRAALRIMGTKAHKI